MQGASAIHAAERLPLGRLALSGLRERRSVLASTRGPYVFPFARQGALEGLVLEWPAVEGAAVALP